jgi:D-sedoheptulose 7-phosphate isomerase
MKDKILRIINESIAAKQLLKNDADSIQIMVEEITECFRNRGKLILFGNGGSAADAQHIAAEFVGRYSLERDALPAIALTTNTSSLTAIGNDFGYEHIFERQVRAICTYNDVVVGLSTSGNSENVLLGIQAAKKANAKTIGLSGNDGGKLAQIVDLAIIVHSNSTPRIQESHILVGHIVSELVELALFGGSVQNRR